MHTDMHMAVRTSAVIVIGVGKECGGVRES